MELDFQEVLDSQIWVEMLQALESAVILVRTKEQEDFGTINVVDLKCSLVGSPDVRRPTNSDYYTTL